jgi:hypothetical protein
MGNHAGTAELGRSSGVAGVQELQNGPSDFSRRGAATPSVKEYWGHILSIQTVFTIQSFPPATPELLQLLNSSIATPELLNMNS